MTPPQALEESGAGLSKLRQGSDTSSAFDTLAQMMADVQFATLDYAAVWIHASIDEAAGSGEGARGKGGLFNPPNSFPVVYGALDLTTAGGEFRRLAHQNPIGMERLLPRHVYRFRLTSRDVLDLRQPAVRTAIALPQDGLFGVTTKYKQLIGEVAFALGIEAIVAPSATGIGDVVAVFPDLNPASKTSREYMGIWLTPIDVPGARMRGGWKCPIPGEAL